MVMPDFSDLDPKSSPFIRVIVEMRNHLASHIDAPIDFGKGLDILEPNYNRLHAEITCPCGEKWHLDRVILGTLTDDCGSDWVILVCNLNDIYGTAIKEAYRVLLM